jgi:hypothetical protein
MQSSDGIEGEATGGSGSVGFAGEGIKDGAGPASCGGSQLVDGAIGGTLRLAVEIAGGVKDQSRDRIKSICGDVAEGVDDIESESSARGRGQFESRSVVEAGIAAVVCRAVKIFGGIEDYAAEGIASVGVSSELVERVLGPLAACGWAEFKHHAAT